MLSQGTTIAVIGGGKMAEAILKGWLSSDAVPATTISPKSFIVSEPTASRRDYLIQTYGVSCVAHTGDIAQADIVVLAVKPQIMNTVLEEIVSLSPFSESLFISIAAGLSTLGLIAMLPEKSRLVRVMPNMPLVIGEGATVVCGSSTASEEDIDLVQALFACIGQADRIDESLMDVAGAISGCGPAYVASMIEALVKAGAKLGLPPEIAKRLAVQTVFGTGKLLHDTNQDPQDLRVSVCSPGGTTLAALEAMNEAGFDNAFSQGVAAAVRRSKELGSC